MKIYQADSIRNIGIFGHGGEGKTTLTEAMLFNAGLLDRMGKVDDGSSVSDYDPEETKRHISISTAVAPFEWNGSKVNIIDAPGFFDFYGEVSAAMALADSALIVVGAVSGPVVGVEKAMNMCKKAGKPRMILLDEPFAGVDPISVNEIQRIVRHLKQRGIGVLITDHNVRETLGICDRAYILAEGGVLAQGTPAELLENPDVRRVYLGDSFRL